MTLMVKRSFKIAAIVVVGLFALVGILSTSVFAAMQFGWLNVRGSIASRNEFFSSTIPTENPKLEIGAVAKSASQYSCVSVNPSGANVATCSWNQSQEWAVIRAGIQKDADKIKAAAVKTDASPRMIVASVIPEQLRFFTSNRETFKKFFEPMKALGTMSQFSLGVAGIKPATANQIEKNLRDAGSAFYPGKDYTSTITYPTGKSHDELLFNRLTDNKDHTYSYIYTGLYLKQIESQWKKDGYDISTRPDVAVTLFNIGFSASKPKDSPQIGGTVITLNGKQYSFGELGTMFYLSDELTDLFPRS
jgi:hypothetical protein